MTASLPAFDTNIYYGKGSGTTVEPCYNRLQTCVRIRNTLAMPTVAFTPNLKRHLDCHEVSVAATTVSEALQVVFQENPRLRSYILDEQGRLRQHVAVFVGGELIHDRVRLTDPVAPDQDIFVMQALSGG